MARLVGGDGEFCVTPLRLLGQQRAQAVKAWLLDKGQVPAERVFVLSTHEGDDGKQPKAKVSRVDFSLR